MKALILAAGLGSRLRPYTDDCPKALVKLGGIPLLDYQLNVLRRAGICDISLITGYLQHKFDCYGLPQFTNPDYASSNMLYSLMCARSCFDGRDDLIICYGDIVYQDEVLASLLAENTDVAIAADQDWLKLWTLRMEDPLADAQSFMMAPGSTRILSLGQKISAVDEAQAQYIGLLKISRRCQIKLLEIYDKLPAAQRRNMYMTDFVQLLIADNLDVTAALHCGGWLEVDSCQDLEIYKDKLAEILPAFMGQHVGGVS